MTLTVSWKHLNKGQCMGFFPGSFCIWASGSGPAQAFGHTGVQIFSLAHLIHSADKTPTPALCQAVKKRVKAQCPQGALLL